LGQLASSLVEVVFPPVCGRCRRLGSLICDDCRGEIGLVRAPLCPRCGRQIEGASPVCPSCTERPLPLNQVRAPLRYAEPTSTLIHQLKYEGYFALAGPLAAYMIAGWPAWEVPVDLIVPIPLHPRRERRRGYNQSALLARHLAGAVGLPVDCAALRRSRHTRPQVELNPRERHENVQGAFSAEPGRVAGRSVLLVDDVFTTGATMSASAEALAAAGATAVSGYCLARVH
jgi:ComF family protein